MNDAPILLLDLPFAAETAPEEVKEYLWSKYNMALVALGTYIKENSGYGVSLVNMVRDANAQASLTHRLRHNPPAVVGITLYTYSLFNAYKMITTIKKESPGTHICVGGPHVNMYPMETMLLDHIDSIVLGDGEVPFLQICEQVIEKGRLGDKQLPPGVYTKNSIPEDGVWTPYVFPDLDELPVPDLSLLGDHKGYRDFLLDKTVGLLNSSRGCPNHCHYCWSEKSRYRPLSVHRVVHMMTRYKAMGVEYVEFWDETFNTSEKRLEQFADALEKADLGLTWAIRGAVVNTVPKETLIRLKKTGLILMQFGLETSSPDLIRFLNKRTSREKIERAFETCKQVGIRTVANLMLNIPGQTRQEMFEDFKLLMKIRPTYVSFNVYNWAPETTLYKNAVKDKTLPGDFWREYAKDPTVLEPVTHPVTEVSMEEVFKLRSRFVLRYYFNFNYMINYIRMIEASEMRRAFRIAFFLVRTWVVTRLTNASEKQGR
ncbi:MAG: B12-binding domain-containing radical SAM protein [Proteobacteria bacterium]|nr:B12-binding domain-containing radical SAM protein [Pseudomonadota bacterium]